MNSHLTPTPNLIHPEHCVVILVDYQQRLMPALHHGTQAMHAAAKLADVAKVLGIPVIGTEQNSAKLGPNLPDIRERCGVTVEKMHFDACVDGLLETVRPTRGMPTRDIVIAGCEAHVCLLQTAIGLLQAGFKVWVVAEACASRTAANHELAMRRLDKAGATLVSVEMVAFEWLRSCEQRGFKDVLALIK